MRVTILFLVLLNVLFAVGGDRANGSDGRLYSCCKVSGDAAYCCTNCCMYRDCESDLDCQ